MLIPVQTPATPALAVTASAPTTVYIDEPPELAMYTIAGSAADGSASTADEGERPMPYTIATMTDRPTHLVRVRELP